MSVVVRASAILRALAGSQQALSLAQIAEQVGMARSSVHRIVRELEGEQLIVAAAARGGYRLGPAVLALAASGHAQLVATMRPRMTELAARVQENVDLAVRSGAAVLIVEQVASAQRLQAVTQVGGTFPAHASSIGKALLSELPDEEIALLLPGELTRYTPGTVTDRQELLAQIRGVRASGIAYDHEEHDIGICAAATLVRSPAGLAQAVAIVAPTHRFEQRSADFAVALAEFGRAVAVAAPAVYR